MVIDWLLSIIKIDFSRPQNIVLFPKVTEKLVRGKKSICFYKKLFKFWGFVPGSFKSTDNQTANH